MANRPGGIPILAAKNPAIIAGEEIVTSDAFTEIAEFAEALGAPAWQQSIAYGSHYPSEHRAFMGSVLRNQAQVRKTLEPYDLLVFVGADVLRMSVWQETDAMPADMPIVQIGLNDWEMGKVYPAEIALRADVKETLKVLTPLVTKLGGEAHRAVAEKRLDALADNNWTAKRAIAVEKAKARADNVPINPDWLMMTITDTMPAGTVVVDEGITSSARLMDFLPYRDRHDFFGMVSGGIGWATPATVGIQLAQPERPVVSIIGDGSTMYSVQALWTAAHLDLPITYVICNNRGYLDPPIDFVGLARSLGMTAQCITEPAKFSDALSASIESRKPTLLEVIVEDSVR